MKVLIADKFPEKYLDDLKNNNLDVIYEPKLGENDLIENAKEVDILVVRSTVVNEETINWLLNISDMFSQWQDDFKLDQNLSKVKFSLLKIPDLEK